MANTEIQFPDVIGKSGKYQAVATLIASYNEVLLGISHVFLLFMFVEVNMHWETDESSGNKTTFASSNCRMDELNQVNLWDNGSVEHSKLVYSSQYMESSLTEKFNFVCERSWWISLTKSLTRVGGLASSLVIGVLSEKFGRRLVCLAFQVTLLASNLCMLFAPIYPIYAAACVISGACISQAYGISVIQVTEIVPASSRPWYGCFIRCWTLFGQIAISGISWYLKDWFNLQVVITVLVALSVPQAWYVLDTPVWLIVHGREEDAKKNTMTIVKRNGRNAEECERMTDMWIEEMKKKQNNKKCGEKGTYSDLFQNRVIAKYTLCNSFSMFLYYFSLHGFIYNMESFGSGLYQDAMIVAAVSLPAIIISGMLVKKYSIRNLEIICLLLSSCLCIVYVFISDWDAARTIICVLFRCTMTPVHCTRLVYASELFPTSVRVVGCGFACTFLMLGTIISPFVKELADVTHVYMPFILFAATTFASAVLIMLLPETKNKPLVQTVEELKNLTEKKKKNRIVVQDNQSFQTKF